MMREILFRGKRKDNGEWVYGLLYKTYSTFYRNYLWTIQHLNKFEIPIAEYDVIPETIGQYTGLIDDKGNKVFEGDILNCITSDFDGSDKFVRYKVRSMTNFEAMGFLEFCNEIEVVGNIHDNTDLLGGKEQ